MASDQTGSVAGRFRAARRDPALAVLEGLHALKHAHRFGAPVLEVVRARSSPAAALAAALAPELLPVLEYARVLDDDVFAQLAPVPHATGVIAIAARPFTDTGPLLAATPAAPVVLLERPSHLSNIGAAVRVAAAAGAAALYTLGGEDPWHPAALRGGAGLQFALPCARLETLPATPRRLVALHPDGDPLDAATLDADSVFAFGTERGGLSAELLARADARLRIPMRAGVSSLNLATAVAVVLYALVSRR